MQHMCALMLVDGRVNFDSAHDNRRMKDPRVLAMRRRVELVADEELERLRPEKHAIVEIVLSDGRQLRHHTRAVRGTAQNPMTRIEVEEKCLGLVEGILGRRRARALCEAVWNLEKLKDLRSLRPLLVA
jgi:2-methylcitrate dehydratase PrpD